MKQINITTTFSVFDSKEELPADLLDLMNQAIEIRKKAYAPDSKFRVGCAIVLDNGKIAPPPPPPQIFKREKQLKSIGLELPLASYIASKLKEKGVNLPEGILTDEELEVELCKL